MNERNRIVSPAGFPVKVVTLSGTWREMGRQYVHSFRNEMRHIWDVMLAPIRDSSEARSLAEALYESQSFNIRRFFDGMAEAGPFTLEQLTLLHAVEYVCGLSGCSALAVWNSRTPDGGLLFGRNYDYNEKYKLLKNDVAVTVYMPADGSQKVLTVGYAGEIYAVNGINESGIFAELNNATPSGGAELDLSREFGTALLLRMLFDVSSLDGTDRFFKTHCCNLSYLIGVSDRKSARCYEWDKTGIKRSPQTAEDLITLSNTYTHPDWPFPVPEEDRCWQSSARRCRMTALAAGRGASLTVEDMKQILSKPLSDGGPFFEDNTVYQMVYDASRFCLHLNVIGNGGWVCLPLGELFGHEAAPEAEINKG